VEGAGWLLGDLDGWLDGSERQRLLQEALQQVETEPGLLGVSAHLLTVAGCPL
jgi:hypothetical protein